MIEDKKKKNAQCLGYRYWIGLNDLTDEGTFRWSYNNQEVLFEEYGDTEPNGLQEENCVKFIYGLWYDLKCSELGWAFCQWEE